MPKVRPFDAAGREAWERDRAVERKKRELGQAIREAMAERRVTQKALAEAVGCCPNSMSAKIRDPGRFTGEEIFRAEVFLGI